jgi:hypothetical protein
MAKDQANGRAAERYLAVAREHAHGNRWRAIGVCLLLVVLFVVVPALIALTVWLAGELRSARAELSKADGQIAELKAAQKKDVDRLMDQFRRHKEEIDTRLTGIAEKKSVPESLVRDVAVLKTKDKNRGEEIKGLKHLENTVDKLKELENKLDKLKEPAVLGELKTRVEKLEGSKGKPGELSKAIEEHLKPIQEKLKEYNQKQEKLKEKQDKLEEKLTLQPRPEPTDTLVLGMHSQSLSLLPLRATLRDLTDPEKRKMPAGCRLNFSVAEGSDKPLEVIPFEKRDPGKNDEAFNSILDPRAGTTDQLQDVGDRIRGLFKDSSAKHKRCVVVASTDCVPALPSQYEQWKGLTVDVVLIGRDDKVKDFRADRLLDWYQFSRFCGGSLVVLGSKDLEADAPRLRSVLQRITQPEFSFPPVKKVSP